MNSIWEVLAPVLFEGEKQDTLMHGFTDNYVKIEVPYEEHLVNEIQVAKLQKIGLSGCVEIAV